jgi:nucleoid-associated protein YgaU
VTDSTALAQQSALSAASSNGNPQLDSSGFQRAELRFEGGKTVKCWFNPKEYSLSKANKWDVKEVVGKGVPVAQFGGGQPRKLTLDLLFDGTDGGEQVRAVTDQLFDLMQVDSKLASGEGKNSGRPPMVTFAWGSFTSFQAVIDSLTAQFTLFDQKGEPLRAQVKLSLIQAGEAEVAKGQNPTTRGDILSTHVVKDGDSLASIAYAAYGDPTAWRTIAEANDIDDPLHLNRGRALSIPRSPA